MPLKGIKGGINSKSFGLNSAAEAVEETDAEFNQTVLLLHGDGSEGEGDTAALGDPNYKAFKDNSTSAHAIAVQGDAYGNDFSPYYYADGYWSVASDSTGIAEFALTSDFDFTGDFTIEGWFWANAINTESTKYRSIFYDGIASGSTQIYIDSANGKLGLWDDSSNRILSASAVPTGEWVHFAFVRSGSGSNNLSLYINGSRSSQATYTAGLIGSSGTAKIGCYTSSSGRWDGYISNLRFVKGSAVYSGASHTVPTTPLTAITYTELLVCQSNRFIDNSTNATSLSVISGAKISTNTPFTQSKTANVGSGFFDGNTDNLTTSGSSDFAFGTGDFTAEAWVYPSSLPSTAVVLDLRYTNNTNADNLAAIVLFGSKLGCFIGANKEAGTDIPAIIGQWNHIVVQRISSTLYFAVNGKVSSTTVSSSDNLNNTGAKVTAGGNIGQTTVSMYTGYIADLRVVNGTGVYGTSDFDVPTTSLISTGSETKLLTCQYSGAVRNVGFLDDSKYNHQITRNGDVSMGTFSPFSLEDGYWSNYISPNSGLTFPNSSAFAFGTGAFTIEFWVFGGADNDQDVILEGRSAVGGNFHITYGGFSSTSLSLRYVPGTGSTITTGTDLIADNTWHHCAIERDGSNNVTLYIDGVSKGTGTDSTNYSTTTGTWSIGYSNHASSNYSNAHYSNFRIVKGSNVYGGAFTPSTAPLTAVTNTQLLTCQSNRFIDNSSNGLTLTLTGTPKVQPFSPFAPTRSYSKDAVGGSAYFDGTGDDLTIMKSAPSQMLTTNWSIEMWVYITETGNIALIDHRGSNGSWGNQSTDGLNFQFYATSSTLYWQVASGTYLSGSYYPTPHSWNHFAVSNDGTQTSVFLNGTRILNGTSGNLASLAAGSAIDRFTIGRNPSGYDTEGYIGPVKIHLTEHYDAGASTITVPTTPFTADENTFLLLNFNNAGIIDHTMKNNLETEGNTRISGQQVKFGTGSIYFDGTGDKLVIPHQEYQQLGTGEFTVELFIYLTSTNGTQGFLGNDGGWYFQIYAGELELALGVSAIIERAWSHSINQWYHLAVSRDSSNDIRIFVDGTQQGAVVNSTANLRHDSNVFHIGNIGPGTSRPFAGGYMDEIRITKGVARYTSNFTAPTKAFANR